MIKVLFLNFAIKKKTSGKTTQMRGHLEEVHPEYVQELTAEKPVRKEKRTCDAGGKDAPIQICSRYSQFFTQQLSAMHLKYKNTTGASIQESKYNTLILESSNNIKSVKGNKQKTHSSVVNFIMLDQKSFSVVKRKGFTQVIK